MMCERVYVCARPVCVFVCVCVRAAAAASCGPHGSSLSSSPAQKPVTKIVFDLAKTTHSWAKKPNPLSRPIWHKAARWLNNYILKRILLVIVKVNLAPDVNVYLSNMHGWIVKLQSLHVTYGRGRICQSETSSLSSTICQSMPIRCRKKEEKWQLQRPRGTEWQEWNLQTDMGETNNNPAEFYYCIKYKSLNIPEMKSHVASYISGNQQIGFSSSRNV